jgi:hypothetical protein
MKEVLSLFMFGIGTLFFLAFLTALKPEAIGAVPGPSKPGYCSTEASPAHECSLPGWLRIFASSPHAEPRPFLQTRGVPGSRAAMAEPV